MSSDSPAGHSSTRRGATTDPHTAAPDSPEPDHSVTRTPGSAADAAPSVIAGAQVPSEPQPIAVVGLACRYADASDPASFLDLIMTGRRAFRRIPPCRVDLADYYSASPGTPDATYSTRAALIEGWRFDRGVFGVSAADYVSTDPAHWLALETAARALAAAGFPGGAGLPADRTAVFVGATTASDVSRVSALRLRWPYTRRILADALFAAEVPADVAARVLRTAAARYLAPFPQVTANTLAGATTGAIATRICAKLGLHGGGIAIDAAGASSLAAVASACLALSAGEIDAAVAGGVDLSLGPLDLVGMAKSGILATGDMRIYDESPTGFLPGEGAGMVLLMRAADARSAHLPVYAQISGWGASSAGQPPEGTRQRHLAAPAPSSILLGLRQALSMARVDPGDIQLIEGTGTAVSAVDDAELTALAGLRSGAPGIAAFGSVAANIGNTRAAAGVAGLIKAVLAIANGVLPPATGIRVPHPLLRDGQAALRLPASPESWPDGARRATVSALGTDGLSVHMVLTNASAKSRPASASWPGRVLTRQAKAGQPASGPPKAPLRLRRARDDRDRNRHSDGRADHAITARGSQLAPWPGGTYSIGTRHPAVFLFQAADQIALSAVLARVADVAPWLSDAEFQDLAVQLTHEAVADGAVKVAVIAGRQEQLARRAAEAITLLPKLAGGLLRTAPGIVAADTADGRVSLLLSGRPGADTELPQRELSRLLAIVRWLDGLGVSATAAIGRGIGELAGLVWAGCTTPADARALVSVRSTVLAAPPDTAPGLLSDAIDEFARYEFVSPRRRLISACTGTELVRAGEVAKLLSAEVFDARLGGASHLDAAVRAGSVGATLLVQTSQEQDLRSAIVKAGVIPAVQIDGEPADYTVIAPAAAALFAAGAMTRPQELYAARPGRPIDIWREQAFIANPCQAPPAADEPEDRAGSGRNAESAAEPAAAAAEPRPAHESAAANPAGQRSAQTPSARSAAGQHAATGQPAIAEPGLGRQSHEPVPGVAPWARCYLEQLRQPGRQLPAAVTGEWRIHTGGCDAAHAMIRESFRHHRSAARTLAVLGDLDDPRTSEAALRAAQDAIETGGLVAISPAANLTGLWASLHAEHPSIGVTVIRAPLTATGLAAAADVAAVAPGEYRELVVDAAAVREPVMVPVPVPGGDFPLGPDDVVLISRDTDTAGLAMAQVIACSGAAIAIIGAEPAGSDKHVTEALEQLRVAGAEVSYETADTSDSEEMSAAVRRITGQLGPITAIGHAVGAAPQRVIADLIPADLRAFLHKQTVVLDQMVAAVHAAGSLVAGPADPAPGSRADDVGQVVARPLRLIMTFGSVTSRYGLPGEAVLAVASDVLARHAECLAAAASDRVAIHVDWPGWEQPGQDWRSEPGMDQAQAGFTALSVTDASRLLLKILATPGLPRRLAVHGRVGIPAPRAIVQAAGSGGTQPPGRFVSDIVVHYPGAELIAESALSIASDPYLADYRLDGVPVLPPAMALEAMAQAASALAGTIVRTATQVEVNAPVVMSGGRARPTTRIRVCALRENGDITVVLRCEHTDYAVDHVRAVFPAHPGAIADSPDETAAARHPAESAASASDFPAPASGQDSRGSLRAEPARQAEQEEETTDASVIYGDLCFQTGRFRRLAGVRPGGSGMAVAWARGADETPWFGAVPGQRGQGLLLGSAGVSDAGLQLVQACVPHRRLLPAGCSAVYFSGLAADGPVTITVAQVGPALPSPHDQSVAVRVPRQRRTANAARSAKAIEASPAGPEPGATALDSGHQSETIWNVEARDATGRLLQRWHGLRMREFGPLPLSGPLPVPLAAAYLERVSAELGLAPGLQIRVARQSTRNSGKGQAPTDEGGWTAAVTDGEEVDALRLSVRAPVPAACAWHSASPSAGQDDTAGSGAASAALAAALGDTDIPVTAHGRSDGAAADTFASVLPSKAAAVAAARAIADCLGDAVSRSDLAITNRHVAGTSWLLLRAGQAQVACAALLVAGLDAPVVIALRTGDPGSAAGPAPAARKRKPSDRTSRRRKGAAADQVSS